MSTLANLAGKVRRLPEGIAELWRRFWEGDKNARLADLEHQRGLIDDYIAKMQFHKNEVERQIRQEKGMETPWGGS